MSVRLAQMRWKETLSQLGNMNMKSRLTRAKIVHAMSIARGGYGQPKAGRRGRRGRRGAGGSFSAASARHELIALTPDRLDQFEAELGAEPADAYVHHVGSRVEVVAPDRREQLALGDGVPGVLRELAQQQELQPGEVHRAAADVRHQPG